MLYYSYTLMFSLFTALLLWYCVSCCSLLDSVCLSGNKRITYLLTCLLTTGAPVDNSARKNTDTCTISRASKFC